MTTYYVKKTGSDSAAGTSEATAWLTVTKAAQTLAAGDTVYIAPGVYREKPVCTNAGTNGTTGLIKYIGDPDCEFFTGEKPGIVRITGCGTDELPTSGNVFDKNSKAYVYLKNLYIDGGSGSSNYAVKCPTSNDGGNVNVYAQHNSRGFYYGINTNCVAIGGYYGFNCSTSTNCVAIGGYCGFNNGTSTNCVAIGGTYGFNNTSTNCVAIGGNCGFNYSTSTNCVAIGGQYSFVGGTITNCVAVGGRYGFDVGTARGCCASGCNSNVDTAPSGDTVQTAPITLFDFMRLFELARIFEPILAPALAQLGKSDASAGTTDILGRPRNMLGDTLDIGPWALSSMAGSWTSGDFNTTAPGIVLTNEGQQAFDIVADGGVAVAVTCQAKYTGTDAALKPQLILRGESITEQTATHSGSASTWQELSVTATPTKDEVLKAICYARDPGTAATLTTALTGDNNDMVFTAKSKGTFGNGITIAYVNPGTASAALGVTVSGKAITVNLATDSGSNITTTAAQIKAFIESATNLNSCFANPLVSIAHASGNDGSGVVTAMTATALSGGADPVSYFSDLAIS